MGHLLRWLTVIKYIREERCIFGDVFLGERRYKYPMAQPNNKLPPSFPCNNNYLLPSKKALQ